MKSATYRDLAWAGLANIVREAAETADSSHELEAALAEFRIGFNAAVDAVPTVAKVLDRLPDDNPETDEGSVDPINRADEIAAQIGRTFKKE